MIRALDLTDLPTAERVLAVQRLAYAVEAELIGFDGIPPLHEDLAALRSSTEHWLGRYSDGELVAAVAYELPDADTVDISRLVVDPAQARRGHGRALLDHLDELEPRATSLVSTGTANVPATTLYLARGYTATGQVEIAPGVTITNFRRTRRPDR
ncbi:GNAT family N-acetyltransferase [Kribbella sp. CA-293567]|uniref:GNAT family N-acetyltransferase n=1 Tax=Kribbella sp. CA-293567 TaxID=3002436 RepID=UPI0022DE01C8|nr:GNAT family N-acetyltransferase [Kribbella sp. CA-293567]WBQ04768.1 GNAT family N-acetyltransferase [Kribbella sp. CA-293567]